MSGTNTHGEEAGPWGRDVGDGGSGVAEGLLLEERSAAVIVAKHGG